MDEPAWQRGIPLARLRALRALVDGQDGARVLGAFSAVKETVLAEALAEDAARVADEPDGPVALLLVARAKVARPLRDFADEAIGEVAVGDWRIRRWAWRDRDALIGLVRALGPGRAWLELWQEAAAERQLAAALGFVWVGARVTAAGEVRGVWRRGPGAGHADPAHAAIDERTLAPLSVPAIDVTGAAAAVAREVATWANHYSTYNVDDKWHAVALRGFGGRVDFIEKPAEMSKKWRADHPDELTWPLGDTPLRARLPELEPLIAAIPGAKHRIRLMRLAAGGRLERHADITDPEAGTRPGRTLRLHLPLVTNPGVAFDMWGLRGEHFRAHMDVGRWWYLDDRKPHRAENAGAVDRIHLVMDVEATPDLLAMLGPNAPHAFDEPDGPPVVLPADAPLPPVPALPTPQPGEAVWVVGDARDVLPQTGGPLADLVLTCPPYGDLERYSDDPRDLSTMDVAGFDAVHAAIIQAAVARLRPGGHAVWVVGEYRLPDGGYAGLVGKTIAAFRAAGCEPVADIALVTPVGSLPVRVARQWEASRKLGKTHQNVLVFRRPE